MPDIGMLRDKIDIKLLILYVLRTLGQPVSFAHLNEVVQGGDVANYFDFSGCFEELLESGQIDVRRGQPDLFYPTPSGVSTLTELENRLPFWARERAMQNATRVLASIRNDDEVTCTIEDVPGGCQVHCTIADQNGTLFSLQLFVPSRFQAEAIKKVFRARPEVLYGNVIQTLTTQLED